MKRLQVKDAAWSERQTCGVAPGICPLFRLPWKPRKFLEQRRVRVQTELQADYDGRGGPCTTPGVLDYTVDVLPSCTTCSLEPWREAGSVVKELSEATVSQESGRRPRTRAAAEDGVDSRGILK